MTGLMVLMLSAVIGFGDQPKTERCRIRDLGIAVGTMATGRWNAITDVPGVLVGHQTIIRGENVRTGVTAILPHDGNIFQEKVPAAIYVGNGFGKLAGVTQVRELGNIETPIVLTNTLGVGTAMTAVVRYTLNQAGNESVRSVNAVVGETNDGYLNDIRGFHVGGSDVQKAIDSAKSGPVPEGAVGAGTGTVAFGFKGGIGTASRMVSAENGTKYVVGVLVQANFGRSLVVNGVAVGEILAARRSRSRQSESGDGSCMIVIATNAPMSPRNLERLAKRALLGLARSGSVMSNGSGDYVIAFSTAYRIPYLGKEETALPPLIANSGITPFFAAVVEATAESVYNALFMAVTMKGRDGHLIEALPIEATREIFKNHGLIQHEQSERDK